MTRRIVIIQGHPDPDPRRYCRALADAYAQGAAAAGHQVTRIDLSSLDFPLLRKQEDFLHGALPRELEPAKEAILKAEHLVFVFPLWLGTMPALLKGFLEQVMRPGVAFAYDSKGFPRTLLSGRSARIIVTMGMPAFFYRWWFFSHGLSGMRRNILKFAGLAPVRETLFGMIEAAGDSKRRKWLDQMRRLGEKAG
ncbi:NAD(P)H-dependent oxidoreductase [Chelativorans intermedius]|uniref:NAD(P)H-dependent oxidoreductase n=1 Tax=Chelativorans intermedius TaxID=515947 RepID=A0ABV6D9K8_9HYPH|nr:NAD(P)H-dependent oxidoreductase [Chelativorans intermedius]MCT8998555.1 NAD(P)H-dependent oxidoreductase [Chelativorans intermedius]